MSNEAQQQAIIEFEKNRNQLIVVSGQKQQYQVQSATMGEAISELEKTSEKKVFKAIGNILIQEDTDSVKKELSEKKESVDLRLKTLQKQEEMLVSKLNKLKSDIQGMAGQADAAIATQTENPAPSAGSKKSKK